MGFCNQLFLGFDGGQSGCRAVLVDGNGHVMERVTGPAFDHVSAVGGVDKIRRAFDACLSVPGIKNARVMSAFFGLTGLASPDSPEHDLVGAILAESFSADLVTLDSDSVSCWAGSLGLQPGVVVAAGTGVVSYGANGHGLHAKLGGWGNIMGDRGGAYDIGRRALQEVASAEDMGGMGNPLAQEILRHFNLPDLRSLQAFLLEQEDRVKLIAECSRLVGIRGQAGDCMCMEILREAGGELGRLAVQTAGVLGWTCDDAVRFSMTGGVFNSGSVLVESFKETIYCAYPNAFISEPMFEPVIGAVLMAWNQAGVDINCVHRLAKLREEWDATS